MPDLYRCPECRTRRRDPRLMVLHMMACDRQLCRCGSYHYPHRPLSGLCSLNPDAQVQLALASRAGTPDEELADLAVAVVWETPGRTFKECPF